MKDSDVLKFGCFGYRHSSNQKIKIIYKEYNENTHETAFEKDNVSVLRGFSLDNILRNDYHNQLKTIDQINTPKVDDYCVIRNWVYRLLKEDMRFRLI